MELWQQLWKGEVYTKAPTFEWAPRVWLLIWGVCWLTTKETLQKSTKSDEEKNGQKQIFHSEFCIKLDFKSYMQR